MIASKTNQDGWYHFHNVLYTVPILGKAVWQAKDCVLCTAQLSNLLFQCIIKCIIQGVCEVVSS